MTREEMRLLSGAELVAAGAARLARGLPRRGLKRGGAERSGAERGREHLLGLRALLQSQRVHKRSVVREIPWSRRAERPSELLRRVDQGTAALVRGGVPASLQETHAHTEVATDEEDWRFSQHSASECGPGDLCVRRDDAARLPVAGDGACLPVAGIRVRVSGSGVALLVLPPPMEVLKGLP